MAPLALSPPKRRIVHSLSQRTAAMLIVHLLVSGTKTHRRELLRAVVHMWCMNVIVFDLWFWQLDRGGPMRRRSKEAPPDFLFRR